MTSTGTQCSSTARVIWLKHCCQWCPSQCPGALPSTALWHSHCLSQRLLPNVKNVLRAQLASALNHLLKVVWFRGIARTSILTSYMKSAGLFTPGVKISSCCVQPLWRYYNIQRGSKVGTANLIEGIPHNWWHSEVTLLYHIMQKIDFSNFFRRLHTSFWVTQSGSASPQCLQLVVCVSVSPYFFSKIVFQLNQFCNL